MRDNVIAKRYAKAALQALPMDKHTEALNQIHLMREIFADSEEIKKMLVSPFVKKSLKLDFVDSVTAHVKNSEFWSQVIKVIILKNRSGITKLFFTELEEMLYDELGQRKIDLIFAHEHSEETINNVKKEIEEMLKTGVVLDIRIDKEIIGGFIAIDKNKVIDASVDSHLKKFATS